MSTSWDTRLASWFGQRHWRVLTERTGVITIGGVRIAYSKGVFDISPPGVFTTPFGTRGRHGFVVIEVDDDGKDIPGSGSAFGEAVLRRANAAYNTISGLPAEDGMEETCG